MGSPAAETYLLSSGGQTSKADVSTASVSLEAPLLGTWMAVLSVCPHGVDPAHVCVLTASSHETRLRHSRSRTRQSPPFSSASCLRPTLGNTRTRVHVRFSADEDFLSALSFPAHLLPLSQLLRKGHLLGQHSGAPRRGTHPPQSTGGWGQAPGCKLKGAPWPPIRFSGATVGLGEQRAAGAAVCFLPPNPGVSSFSSTTHPQRVFCFIAE